MHLSITLYEESSQYLEEEEEWTRKHEFNKKIIYIFLFAVLVGVG
jgi:hypothetical protein